MTMEQPAFWRVHCHIGHHPGQWQRWYRDQCCAIGWPPERWNEQENQDGFSTSDLSEDADFATSVRHCRRMRAGDWIVATLTGNRVGRIGRVFRVAIEDEDWDPVVLPSKRHPFGENGRRIEVRWDLTAGPSDPSQVVWLPENSRLLGGQVRGTVRQLPLSSLHVIRSAMSDPANWVSLASAFNLETTLSAYIALHPHRLEDGLVSHSSFGANETRMPNKGRVDVLLEDKEGQTLVVECKQGAATVDACKQVLGYKDEIAKLVAAGQKVRTMVVYGGSRRVALDVAAYAQEHEIELVHFDLAVTFSNQV